MLQSLLSLNGNKLNILVLLLAVSGVTFLAYKPGLSGPFVFDDIPNLVENRALHIDSLSLETVLDAIHAVRSGPFGRPVAYASFALNYYFFGSESFSFKLTNVTIHLVNGILIFMFTGLCLRGYRHVHRQTLSKQSIRWIALTVASLWMLHPLALTSVLYIVQRMASLSALFTLLSLCFYVRGRLTQFIGGSGLSQILLSLIICTPLALFSKENAILIPLFVLLIEVFILRFNSMPIIDKRLTRFLTILLISLAIGSIFQTEKFLNWLVQSYEIRPFTLYEHTLTETRIIWFYVKLILLPRLADLGLYHDDIPLSYNIFTPISTMPSILGLIVIGIIAVSVRKKAPILCFGISFFLIGHSLESSIFSLEIAHEHRNYLPMFGILLSIGYYGLHPIIVNRFRLPIICGFLLMISLLWGITFVRSSQWHDVGELAFSLAYYHPHSARSNYEAGRLLTQLIETEPNGSDNEQLYRHAKAFFETAYQSDKSNLSGLLAILYIDSLLNKPLDEDVLKRLKFQISNTPILPATATSISNLHKCWLYGKCIIDNQILANLYRTASRNNLASNKTHASFKNELAIIELHSGNLQIALQLFKQAIGYTPNQGQLWFNLIHVLTNTGQFEEAKQRLITVKRRFTDVKSQEKIARLERIYNDKLRAAEAG